jgi:hypothetical protein
MKLHPSYQSTIYNGQHCDQQQSQLQQHLVPLVILFVLVLEMHLTLVVTCTVDLLQHEVDGYVTGTSQILEILFTETHS